MFENEVQVAKEITTSEYFDLWWQSMTQNPADNLSAGAFVVAILVAALIKWLRANSTRTSSQG